MDVRLNGKKILFATVPADGHFNPLTGLAVYLQHLGCDVRWYTSPIFRDKCERLGITHYPFQQALDINGTNINEKYPERIAIHDVGKKLDSDLRVLFVDRSIEYYEDIRNIHEEFGFELMISDSLFSAIPFVRHLLQVPVISIGIAPLAEDSVNLAPYGMGLLPPEDDAQRQKYADLRNVTSDIILRNVIDRYSAFLDQYKVPYKESIIFDLLIKQSSLYLQIGTPSFEYPRSDMGKNIRFIGALLPARGKSGHAPWFDPRLKTYKKIVLVTEGTVEIDMSKLLEPTFQAFINTDILVIATTAGHSTAALREKYKADNLIIEDYIPFDALMPYVHVYVTNGGYGGTLLAISHQLPIVAAGVYETKNEICSRIGYFNYGINLETEQPSPEQIRSAVEEVLSNKLYRNNVLQLSAEMDSYDALTLCTGYIREVLHLPV